MASDDVIAGNPIEVYSFQSQYDITKQPHYTYNYIRKLTCRSGFMTTERTIWASKVSELSRMGQ